MAWTTKIPTGGAITINGTKLSFDRCTTVYIEDSADITVHKPDGRSIDFSAKPRDQHQTTGA